MFPPGLPGLGLLLLRASVATAILVEDIAHRQALSVWLQGPAVLVALALLVGYLTPIVAIAGLVLHGLVWLALDGTAASLSLVIGFDAIALALLGPGAYSVDSYRFGRREVVLPPP